MQARTHADPANARAAGQHMGSVSVARNAHGVEVREPIRLRAHSRPTVALKLSSRVPDTTQAGRMDIDAVRWRYKRNGGDDVRA